MFLKTSALSYVLVVVCISAGADVKFTDVADVSGIEFQHFTGATGARYMPETMGAGVLTAITIMTAIWTYL